MFTGVKTYVYTTNLLKTRFLLQIKFKMSHWAVTKRPWQQGIQQSDTYHTTTYILNLWTQQFKGCLVLHYHV